MLLLFLKMHSETKVQKENIQMSFLVGNLLDVSTIVCPTLETADLFRGLKPPPSPIENHCNLSLALQLLPSLKRPLCSFSSASEAVKCHFPFAFNFL